MGKMTVDSHGSFASYSPFGGNPGLLNGIPTHIGGVNASMESTDSGSTRSRDRSLLHSALQVTRAVDVDKSSLVEEMQCSFNTKLVHAKIIKEARSFGLPAHALRLSTFGEDGGSDFAAKELLRIYFTNAWTDYLSDHSEERQKVEQFCQSSDVSFDHAVEQYSKELCVNEATDASNLSRANDLVAACANPDVKCKITLRFLRTAQLSSSKPSCLKALAKEAAGWAMNEEIRSELEEATRLLGIDEIVRRYCGNKAAEVFRVSNPNHSVRLVEYVTRKINSPSVLSDILYLCSAFTHLSPLEYCTTLIERIITVSLDPSTNDNQPRADQCTAVMQKIYEIDSRLAESVAVRTCIFCADLMQDHAPSVANSVATVEHAEVCCSAIAICRTAANLSPQGTMLKCQKSLLPETRSNPWAELMREFQRVHDLFEEFSISICLAELRVGRTHDSLMTGLVQKAVDRTEMEIDAEQSEKCLKLKLTKARRGCGLLFGDDSTVITSEWCKAIGGVACNLVKRGNEELCMALLEASGLLDEIHNASAYQTIVSVTLALCSKASDTTTSFSDVDNMQSERAMKSIILANSLLQDHALIFCPGPLLPLMLFLSNLVDVATQIILKSDCGVGEKMDNYKQTMYEKSRIRRQPLSRSKIHSDAESDQLYTSTVNLHPSWHTGDGLLLPPMEALSECMAYCKGLLAPRSGDSTSNLLNVHDFLGSRGAHSISLRMLSCASVVTSSNRSVGMNEILRQQQERILQKIFFNLAERSLGGSGTGNTNAKIDYELAVPALLNLHMKVAFKVRKRETAVFDSVPVCHSMHIDANNSTFFPIFQAYKRCLPSAMSRRDFDRVIALANVGKRAAGTTSPYEDQQSKQTSGWKNQKNFVLQCQTLASKAFWWSVLQRFGVSFDPSSFDNTENTEAAKDYITSLIFEVIRCASTTMKKASTVQILATDFCKAFELDCKLALQKHIEFLLSWPGEGQMHDIRNDLISCAAAVNDLLKQLPNKVARSSTLRKCLVALEKVEQSGKDFDRYSMVLSIYQNELRGMLSLQSKANSVQSVCLQQEIELIDRRQDALAILSSFFRDKKPEERPCFQKCFLPLPAALELETDSDTPKLASILGSRGDDSESSFDPIQALHHCLQSEPGPSTTSALGPICISLGLPSGYIHARALIECMVSAKSLGGSLPPFETDVIPVMKRLKLALDAAELAEWCASQYDIDSAERLSCLGVALDHAIKASTEAEQARRTTRQKDRNILVEKERNALERVKRLSSAKSALSDIITAKTVLNNAVSQVEDPAIAKILSTIVEKARCTKDDDGNISPEQFAENLLVEGSLASAEASLDVGVCLDMVGLCHIASATHKACSALEDQYSHIDVGRISRTLVRRWLLHGDEGKGALAEETSNQQRVNTGKKMNDVSMDCSMDEDDTVEFVLDLNMAIGNTAWTDDVGFNEPERKKLKTMTADEEQSSLKATTTRENSEYLSSRVGLRVAFVMSFAQDFHPRDEDEEVLNEENMDPNNAVHRKEMRVSDDLARKHARYLMKLVFSKSAFDKSKIDSSALDSGQSVRSGGLGAASVNTKRVTRPEGKALTFAMRHRALRAVSALCPEEVMNAVIAEENSFGGEKCSLSKCCFGSFVAKEIEEMGLPLPHSDLIQLSMMHQPSYARTLWRHHGSSSCNGYKGRLMLLMLELALREGKIVDAQLIASILTEVINLNLPRTNLMICECIARVDNIGEVFTTNDGDIGSLVLKVLKKLVASVLHEISTQDEVGDEIQIVSTVQRLGRLITSFMSSGISQREVDFLIDSMSKTAQQCKGEKTVNGILEVAATIIREMKDEHQKSEMLQKLCSMVGDIAFRSRIATVVGASRSKPNGFASTKDCLGHLLHMENNFNSNISKAIFQEGHTHSMKL